MTDERSTAEMIPELYILIREYEAWMETAEEAEEQRRFTRILHELRACLIQFENIA